MSLYQVHAFVCTNQRPQGDAKGCCHSKGAAELLDKLKEKMHSQERSYTFRINKAGCLGQCSKGVCMVVYPQAIWYQNVKVSDLDELIEGFEKKQPIKRLMLNQNNS